MGCSFDGLNPHGGHGNRREEYYALLVSRSIFSQKWNFSDLVCNWQVNEDGQFVRGYMGCWR
jgi:hypothetical protein